MNSPNNSIPHIIHYCWFGNGEKPNSIKRYIDGWKEKLPDYQIVEWNESNFSVQDAPIYVQEAYSTGKYAFVSDYVRIKALYEHGGVYLDTDIEIVKRFDEVLADRELVLCFESDKSLETAFIACAQGNRYIGEFCRTYEDRRFINPDGSYDMSVINQHFSEFLERKCGINLLDERLQILEESKTIVYPREYFAAFDISNWHIKPTENTFTIHHMNASWSNSKKKIYFGFIHLLQKILGFDGYDKLKGLWDHIK